jgi:Zn ribbon nucleic-acid-binding protein
MRCAGAGDRRSSAWMSEWREQRVREQVRLVSCVECGSWSDADWRGWRAYRVDDPELDEPPALGLYCPACAEAEFGPDV